jgi:manganese/iron transport system permease protein
MDNIFLKAFTLSVLSGAECGLIGAFVFLLDIPLIGVAVAHAAMAGGIWALVLNAPVKITAFISSALSSAAVGPVSEKGRMNSGSALGIVFAALTGAAFMGIGFLGQKQQAAFGMLWGNVFLADWSDILLIGAVLACLIVMFIALRRQYSAMLFDMEMAEASGINSRLLYYLLLLVTGVVITVNLQVAGGLMLSGFVILPPAAARNLTSNFTRFAFLSSVLGAAGGAAGSLASFAFNLPVSASVILTMTAVYMVTLIPRGAHGR